MIDDRQDSVLAQRLRQEVNTRLARSLHVRHLDAGSCNGCEWEVAALLNPYHDLQRLGIDFVASPRHADLLLVTGIMTRNLEDAARRTYEAMPEPRLVVAVGACAISGGVFAGSYAGRDGVADVLPVDVFVPGCPPRPEAVIHGLLTAVGRMAPASPNDAARGAGPRPVASAPPASGGTGPHEGGPSTRLARSRATG
jgi:Ni,Fe-hydrogenase III small subunit